MGERTGQYWDLDEADWVSFEPAPSADAEFAGFDELADLGGKPSGKDAAAGAASRLT